MTSVAFLDLRRQHVALRDELAPLVGEVLDENRFLHGAAVGRFELRFAHWCGAEHAVGVASGTDAIALALQALGVEPGDEVVTAANTCVPTVAAIEQIGATPVLADVDPDTWTLDPEAFEQACTKRTRAVVPVHLYGRCAAMEPIVEIARDRGLVVVEDAAQAHGASIGHRRAGTLGDAAAFSFYPTKNLGAIGDGGAVVTRSAEVAKRVRMLASYGERASYDSELRHGRNSRLATLQAEVLDVKLSRLDEWNARRARLAERYRALLVDTSLTVPAEPRGGAHAWHLFVVLSDARDRMRDALATLGIETLVHYPRAVHQQPAYRYLAHDRLVISERLAGQVLSLPLYPELSDDEAARVVAALREVAT